METVPQCPYCRARKSAVKAGKRKTQTGLRQMYQCKVCNRKFTPGKYSRMRNFPELILTALRLRKTGMSYRHISISLLLMYEIDVSDVTVMKWVKKYG